MSIHNSSLDVIVIHSLNGVNGETWLNAAEHGDNRRRGWGACAVCPAPCAQRERETAIASELSDTNMENHSSSPPNPRPPGHQTISMGGGRGGGGGGGGVNTQGSREGIKQLGKVSPVVLIVN